MIVLVTNKIGDDTIRGIPLQLGNKPNCVLCEFVMSKLDEMLEDKKTEVCFINIPDWQN